MSLGILTLISRISHYCIAMILERRGFLRHMISTAIYEAATREMSSMGFENAMDIGDRILHARRSVL
ncbi:hypothetical protein SAMN04487770_1267 [Butyrivibrio sp. ob235]|nr:hypothetical protein SAMN04487770_1267 [Butyrivibrio sp. ob235]